MRLIEVDERVYFFRGYKVVDDDRGFDMWADTTTLYISLYDGKNELAPLLGRGVLHINPADFAKQMTTMKARNASTNVEALTAVGKFSAFFTGAIAETYGGPLAPFRVHDADAAERTHRLLRVCDAERHTVTTDDNVELLLTRYRDPARTEYYGPVMLVHGLGVSSKIFSVDTIETNLLEYLYENGFDVWLFDGRASIDMVTAKQRFNADDVARYDYPAAVAKILAVTKKDSIQVVAHCFGGCTMSMSLLAGLQGVRSVVFSQVATHYDAPLMSELKTGLHIPSLLEKLGVDSMTAYRDNHADWLSKLYDRALAFQPQQHEEWSNSPIDKRITFIYGQLWESSNLNRDTHDNLHELFGVANIESLQHLALMMRKGHAVNSDGGESYLPNADKLKIPMLFIHGAENQTYLPISTEKAASFLSEVNGEQWYEVKVIPDYGHIDCILGKEAVDDVYPYIKNHLQQH
jgi:cholesterol oxidase